MKLPLPGIMWTTSSRSNDQGLCVEVGHNTAPTTGLVQVRDSKDPSGPLLTFPAGAWSAFTAAAGRLAAA